MSGAGPVRRFMVPNDMEAVGAANASLEEFLGEASVEADVVFPVLLAFEEVVTNTIKYGYDDDEKHEIVVEACVEAERVMLEFVDDGHEFDPLQAPPPDLESPIEERPIGGLGIHLLRNLTERLSYRRDSGKNVLSLSFSRRPE